MNKIFIPHVTDLIEHQRISYYDFLYKGIEEEFLLLPNPIPLNVNIPTRLKKTSVYYYFHPNEVFIMGPNYTYTYSLNNNLTYAIQVYIGSSYTYPFVFIKDFYPICKSLFKILQSNNSTNFIKKKVLKILKKFHPLFNYSKLYIGKNFKKFWLSLSQDITNTFQNYCIYRLKNLKASDTPFKEIKKLWMKHKTFIGEIPLMTDEGTFLVTGCERIVISQIIRNSGVYFQKMFCPRLGIKYCANILSDQGSWTKFTLMTGLELELISSEEESEETIEEDITEINKNLANTNKLKIKDNEVDLTNYQNDFIFVEFFQSEELDIEGFKISMYEFFQWFGISWKEIQASLKYPDYLQNQEHIQKKIFSSL